MEKKYQLRSLIVASECMWRYLSLLMLTTDKFCTGIEYLRLPSILFIYKVSETGVDFSRTV